MQTLTHSAFLQALGYTIANSLWQMALLWVAVMILHSVFKFSATVKYRIAVTAQISGFAWFLITLFFYFKTSSLALAQAEILQASSNTVLVPQNADEYGNSILSFIVKTEQMLPYLSVAYLFLLSFLIIKWIRSYRYTNLIQNNGLHKIDVEWKLFVKKLAGELGIRADVKIYLSEIVNSPLTIGFLKPVILIPIASMNHLTVQQLEAIILHEMAHIRRLDYLINLFVSIIELCLFFNPFTQLISRIIKDERENSCDDWVLQYQYQPAMYAEALLRIAYLQSTPKLAMAAAGNNKQVLLTRIKRMLDQNQKKFNYRQHLLALLLMTGVLSSLAWFQPNKQNTTAKKDLSVTQPAVVEPLAVKVDNPLFNPVFFLSKPLKEEVKKAAKEAEKKYKEAQIVVRELNIPSISTVGAEKLNELNLGRMNADLLRLKNDMKDRERDLAALNNLRLNTWVNGNMTIGGNSLFADSLVSYNKQLNSLFTAQVAAPIVVNFEKIGEEMKRAKEEMLKLSKQGLGKFDEKAFEKQFMESFKLVPLTFATADNNYERVVSRWTDAASAQVELKRRSETMRENAENTEKRRAQSQLKMAQLDSLRAANKFKITAGQGVWVYTTIDDEAPVATKSVSGNGARVTGTRTPPVAQNYSYSATLPRKPQDAVVGPPEENVTTPKTVHGYFRPRIATSEGGGQTREATAPKLKTVNGAQTIILDGKAVEIKDQNMKERKILRVESF